MQIVSQARNIMATEEKFSIQYQEDFVRHGPLRPLIGEKAEYRIQYQVTLSGMVVSDSS